MLTWKTTWTYWSTPDSLAGIVASAAVVLLHMCQTAIRGTYVVRTHPQGIMEALQRKHEAVPPTGRWFLRLGSLGKYRNIAWGNNIGLGRVACRCFWIECQSCNQECFARQWRGLRQIVFFVFTAFRYASGERPRRAGRDTSNT